MYDFHYQVVTVLYVWVKKHTSKADGEALTIKMGFYGQVGAVVGPASQLLLVWSDAFGAPLHQETQLACDGIPGNEYVVSTVPPPGTGLGSPPIPGTSPDGVGLGDGGSGSGMISPSSSSSIFGDDNSSSNSCLYY